MGAIEHHRLLEQIEPILALLHYRGIVDSENNRRDVEAALDKVRAVLDGGSVGESDIQLVAERDALAQTVQRVRDLCVGITPAFPEGGSWQMGQHSLAQKILSVLDSGSES